MHKIAFIIATKDRPNEIRKMLESIASGTVFPDEIIIVDGGQKTVEFVVKAFPTLKILYLRCVPPSATKQRNLGIRSISAAMTLIGFFDDDIILQPDALERMLEFWEKAEYKFGGAAFNMINHPRMDASAIKSLRIVEFLGLYSSRPGKVMPSGFQTMIGRVSGTIGVQWLPTTASVFRRDIFSKIGFDEWFEGYSYLEDLDFSYRIGKKYTLTVVADAGYFHYPALSGRGKGVEFGRREMRNRVYFVKKHSELSLSRCWIGLMIRLALSFRLAVKSLRYYNWQLFWGNCLGLADLLMGRPQKETECEK